MPEYRTIAPPRPEPVVNAAKLASAVSGVVLAVGVALVAVGITTQEEVENWATIAGAIVTAAGTLVAIVLPYIQALKARAEVTPKDDPVNDEGVPLVPQYGPNAPQTSPHSVPPRDV